MPRSNHDSLGPYTTVLDGDGKVHLGRIDPGETGGMHKEEGVARLDIVAGEFEELSNLLTYAGQHALLVVLQGRDASGKDGAARTILLHTNVQNTLVHPFKVPTEEERAHDFLWRVHRVVPRRGNIALFNRSHYEDVIAARVHGLVPEAVWRARFDHINAFERLLADNDTLVVKFCLHVSRAERVERLLEREKDPRTAWKLNPGDWRELAIDKEVTRAYEEALHRCASPDLPWYLVPADKKWFRNLAIMDQLVRVLRPHRQRWLATLKKMRRTALAEIKPLRERARQS